MKKHVVYFFVAFVVVTLWVPAGHAGDAVCSEIRQMIVGKTYVAKEPLYDTKVDNDGIIDLERDKQEIPRGAHFKVLKVECEGGKLEIKLRQVARKKLEAVEVKFRLSKAERQMPNAIEQFQQMADYVWDDVSEPMHVDNPNIKVTVTR